MAAKGNKETIFLGPTLEFPSSGLIVTVENIKKQSNKLKEWKENNTRTLVLDQLFPFLSSRKNALFDNSLAPEGTEKWVLKLAEYSSAITS